jgi:glycosyltransferase involved in cell wall biosynthesis
MATDHPESDLPRTGERDVPQIGGEIELEDLHRSEWTRALQREIEARDSKLAQLSDAAKKREDQLAMELGRQSTHFTESLSRLQRELQDQSEQSAECIRELKAEIEHLKITRFQAKRENYSIKTSLSWRLTWPLRVLRDAGVAFVSKSQVRFRLRSGHRPSSASITANAHSVADLSPPTDGDVGSHDQRPGVDRQSIEWFTEGLSSLNRKKETVLLVTHDSSRTGAPIIALNLVRALRQKYNVVALILRDGALGYEFLAGSDLVIGPLSAEQRSPYFLTALFREIAARAPLKFAIVNSIVSTTALSALWENDIAIVHLIHEFFSYIRPRGQFRSSAFYSGERIFSSEIVRENARQELPERTCPGRVLPQGMCLPPLRPDPRERARIRSSLRPPGWPGDTVVILGAGTVTFRKGVDLFIACAKRVAEMAPAKKFRFAWFGEGMETGLDAKYSLYLTDQIQRSELNEVAVILKAVSDMEGAYHESDILFLSSRLDPLPLVSLEAIHYAKPVVCFKSATGIVEYLAHDPLASFGIVPFLDVESAACRIFRLIEDGDLRFQVGQASKKVTKSQFRFERYVAELDGIAQECALKKQQEKADRLVISQSNLFDTGFFSCPLSPQSSRDPIRHYISAYSSGIRPRKAVPGFHPGIYEERNETKGRDPLAHYLDSGKPPGPWSFEVIHKASEAPRAEQSLRVGLHLHLYYHEMSGEIFERLRGVNRRIDLLISVTSLTAGEAVEQMFSRYSQGSIDVRVFENQGRDIGPFLTGFGKDILERYDIIGHVHAKNSAGRGNGAESLTPAFLESIAQWRRFLYANLLGGEHAMADTIIQRLSTDDTLGLVFPDDPHLLGWGENLPYALELARRLGIEGSLPKTTFNFPVGSMFWARTAALRPLFELGFTWDEYPKEPVPYDGSLLHAIERILPFVVESAGFRSAVTYVAGVTR